jgi:hypothetical protein
MSNKQNDEWLANNYELFQEALLENNLSLAQDILADAKDAGFTEAAKAMEKELVEGSQVKSVDELIVHLSKHTGI